MLNFVALAFNPKIALVCLQLQYTIASFIFFSTNLLLLSFFIVKMLRRTMTLFGTDSAGSELSRASVFPRMRRVKSKFKVSERHKNELYYVSIEGKETERKR